MNENLPIISESDYYHMGDICFRLPYDEEKLSENLDDFFNDIECCIDFNSREDVASIITLSSNIPIFKKEVIETFPDGSHYFESGEQIAFLDLSREISDFIKEQQELYEDY